MMFEENLTQQTKIVLAVNKNIILVFWKERKEFVVVTSFDDCRVGDYVDCWQCGCYFDDCDKAIKYYQEIIKRIEKHEVDYSLTLKNLIEKLNIIYKNQLGNEVAFIINKNGKQIYYEDCNEICSSDSIPKDIEIVLDLDVNFDYYDDGTNKIAIIIEV